MRSIITKGEPVRFGAENVRASTQSVLADNSIGETFKRYPPRVRHRFFIVYKQYSTFPCWRIP